MWGVVHGVGAGRVLRFEREIARPVARVWAALVTPERVADWLLADADIEPRVGGHYHLRFRNGPHVMLGTITRFEPPQALGYTWPESEDTRDSHVLWELSATPAGTRLVLTHALPGGGAVADLLSGWHWHLDALADGGVAAWDAAGWRALQAAYLARIQ